MDIGNCFIGQEYDGVLDVREGETFYNILNFCSHNVEEVIITDTIQKKL